MQLAAGEGPDIARVTELGGPSKYYLDITPYVKDAKYWEANFGQTLAWLRPTAGDKGIYGMMTQLTVTGRTSTRRSSSRRMSVAGPQATWDHWVDASRSGGATQVPFAIASIAAAIASRPGDKHGREVFRGKGHLVVDEGYRAMAETLRLEP